MRNGLLNMLSSLKDDFIDGTQIEIINNTEAVIQGFKGIIEYTDTIIRMNIKEKQLEIYGQKLCISCLSSDSIVVRGIISRIEWVG